MFAGVFLLASVTRQLKAEGSDNPQSSLAQAWRLKLGACREMGRLSRGWPEQLGGSNAKYR